MNFEHLLEKPIWQMTGEEFLSLLKNSKRDSEKDLETQSNIIAPSSNNKYVYGIRGIANLLNCSISTANRIKKKGVIDKAIIQQGRTIIVDAEKALELLKNDSQ